MNIDDFGKLFLFYLCFILEHFTGAKIDCPFTRGTAVIWVRISLNTLLLSNICTFLPGSILEPEKCRIYYGRVRNFLGILCLPGHHILQAGIRLQGEKRDMSQMTARRGVLFLRDISSSLKVDLGWISHTPFSKYCFSPCLNLAKPHSNKGRAGIIMPILSVGAFSTDSL